MIDHEELFLAFRNRLRESPDISDTMCAYENVSFKRTVGVAYLEEEFVGPATNRRVTFGSRPQREETGVYIVRWYGPTNAGDGAIRAAVDGILALFDLDWSTTLEDGSDVQVRGDTGPTAPQVVPRPAGWSVCTITIPWVARTRAGAAT
jgi:hypothetical protein